MIETVFYAGGKSGPNIRADGKGGLLERGWYAIRFGKPNGPFSTERKAKNFLKSTPTPEEIEGSK